MLQDPAWWRFVPVYNDRLTEFARTNGHELIDVQGLFARDYPKEFVDGCHFTGRGHDLLGGILVAQVLKRIAK